MNNNYPRGFLRMLPLLAIVILPTDSVAEGWEIGARSTVVTAGGEPANDIISVGIFARYPLSTDSMLGMAIERAKSDFETPAKLLGLKQDSSADPIDSTTKATTVSVWYERLLGSPGASRWFITGGLGVSKPEVDDTSGPLAGGGSFSITTDPGTEIIASFSGGWRHRFGGQWSTEIALRVDRHFADWEVKDRVSGRSTTIDDYTGVGVHVGLSYQF